MRWTLLMRWTARVSWSRIVAAYVEVASACDREGIRGPRELRSAIAVGPEHRREREHDGSPERRDRREQARSRERSCDQRDRVARVTPR